MSKDFVDDLASMIEADTQSKNTSPLGRFDDTNLKGVSKLAQDISNKEAEIKQIEEKLKAAKKALLKMTDEELPLMLTEMGVSSFKLADGSSVTIKPIYGASIPVASKDAAHEWLRENGYGDIVKNVVSVNFGMGEDDKASEFKEMAQRQGLEPNHAETVHSSTLRAWVKERTEAGEDFPMELFGAFVGQRAEIKGAK